jgi:amidase
MPDLEFATVIQQRTWVAAGTVTARDLVEHSLARIAALEPVLNAFAAVRAAEARVEADALDRATGVRGPLHGVPMAIKDENDVAGLPTAYGGASVTTLAERDSEVVARLRAAGAIIIGKTRMPEFGIWPFTESDAQGITRNPWNPERSTAGSSGGTAAAVASGMVAAGIGGDGGGSIRLPSSWCGLFGLKAQRGRVSAAPNADLWRSLGTLGPLTRTVADSALIYDVIAGSTDRDRFSARPLSGALLDAARAAAPGRLRILVSAKNPTGGPRADAETRAALARTADVLRELGHQVVELDPRYPLMTAQFLLQVMCGVSDEATRVEHPERLERRTRTLVSLARPFLGLGAWAERSAQARGEAFLARLFADADLLITPTTPTPAAPVGQLTGLGFFRAMARATPVASFTSLWNVLGNPAAAVPAGFTAQGLPLSVQVVAPQNGEVALMALCAQLEQAQPWADRRPAVKPRPSVAPVA